MVTRVLVKDMTAEEYARHKAANRRSVKPKERIRNCTYDEAKRKKKLARKLERELVKLEKLWARQDALAEKRAETLRRIEARKLGAAGVLSKD